VEMRFRQASAEAGFTISVVTALLAVVIMVVPWTATSRRQWPPSRPLSGPREGQLDRVGPAGRNAVESGGVRQANANVLQSGAIGRGGANHLPVPTVPADRTPGTVDPDAIPQDLPSGQDVATKRILDDDTQQTALFIASTDDPEVARETPWDGRSPRRNVPQSGQDGHVS